MSRPEIPEAIKRAKLKRLFDPTTIAIVGADETNPYAARPLRTLDSDAQVFFVSNRSTSAFGRDTYPSLKHVGVPIDAVFSMMSAKWTVSLAEEAADLDVGGLISIAGGFAEFGDEGIELQARLSSAALRGNMPVIGPNGVGYINVPKKLDLTMAAPFERRAGGVSIISHSGAVLEAFAASAWRAGGVGLNYLIAAGNEPVTDMADYLEYLVDDDETRVICLIVEKIRRPREFFAAAARAHLAGKPIVAIKLARTERSQRMAMSHTGSLTGDAWVYEQAFKQAGILRADEVDELVDRVQFLEQIPKERWTPINGLFVLTATGGVAAMAADLAEEEGVNIPDDKRLAEWVGTILPGTTVANPLDATGFTVSRHDVFRLLLETYTEGPEFDAYVFFNQVAEWNTRQVTLSEMFAEHAKRSGRPAVISPLAGPGARWLDETSVKNEIGVGNGLRGTLRGFSTMGAFMRLRPGLHVGSPTAVTSLPRPAVAPVISEIGPILSFVDTMTLLAGAGVPVAQYQVVRADDAIRVSFAGPYVVKLADLAHRSEHDAVRAGVSADRLDEVVDELRALANENSLPNAVVIQEQVVSSGEAFIGVRGTSELGPVVAFGLGGVFVEILKRISGRLAPLSMDDAAELISEFDDLDVINGARGQPAWNREQLAQILAAVGELAAAGSDWIDTLDINPLIYGPRGFVAVDGLCLLTSV